VATDRRELLPVGPAAVQILDRFTLPAMIGPELVEARDRVDQGRRPWK
jgi:hypothetical protein